MDYSILDKVSPELQANVISQLSPNDVRQLIQATGRRYLQLFNFFNDTTHTANAFFTQPAVAWTTFSGKIHRGLINVIEIFNFSELKTAEFLKRFGTTTNVIVFHISYETDDSSAPNFNQFLASLLPKSQIFLTYVPDFLTLKLHVLKKTGHLHIGDSSFLKINVGKSQCPEPLRWGSVSEMKTWNTSEAFIERCSFEDSPTDSLTLDASECVDIKKKEFKADIIDIKGLKTMKNVTLLGTKAHLHYQDTYHHNIEGPTDFRDITTEEVRNTAVDALFAPNLESLAVFYATPMHLPKFTNIRAPKLNHANFELQESDDVDCDPNGPATNRSTELNFDFLQSLVSLRSFRSNCIILNCSSFPYLKQLDLVMQQPFPDSAKLEFPSLRTLDIVLDGFGKCPKIHAPELSKYNIMAFAYDVSDDDDMLWGLPVALAQFRKLTHLKILLENIRPSPRVRRQVEQYRQTYKRQLKSYDFQVSTRSADDFF